MLRQAAATGVEVRTYYDAPLHRLGAYRDAERWGDLATTEALSRRVVSLPMANDLTVDEVHRVVEVVLGAAGSRDGREVFAASMSGGPRQG